VRDKLERQLASLQPDARVSAPLHWHEVPNCEPADFTVFTLPKRFREIGDPHANIDAAPGSLERLLELAEKDAAAGLMDAPWPPHFRKTAREARRVAPSRAKAATEKSRAKVPLLVVAKSPSKDAALKGLDKWKERHREIADLLAPDDVLVDSMRGRSSTWTRVRVNLRHVPESLQPLHEPPDPDYDPAVEWRTSRGSKRDA
jgi:bifunctional non-homologous end joining protein LigD